MDWSSAFSRLAEAKDFIQSRIAHLSSLSRSCSVHFSLATCHHLLGSDLQNTTTAIKFAQLARQKTSKGEEEEEEVNDEEEESELEWLIELLERQRSVEEARVKGRKELEKWPLVKLGMPQYTQVSSLQLKCRAKEEILLWYHRKDYVVYVCYLLFHATLEADLVSFVRSFSHMFDHSHLTFVRWSGQVYYVLFCEIVSCHNISTISCPLTI